MLLSTSYRWSWSDGPHQVKQPEINLFSKFLQQLESNKSGDYVVSCPCKIGIREEYTVATGVKRHTNIHGIWFQAAG